MIASTTTHVDLGDGNRTTLERWGESGPALLCVHGITSSRRSWARFAEHAAATHRVFAYDQRGHGDSANVLGPMTLERSLLDLEAVTRAIGGDLRALLGHSWGGAVVILGGRRVACERIVAIDPMIHQAAGSWYGDFVDDLREVFGAPPQQREALIRAAYATLPPIEIDAKVHAMRSMTLEPIVALGDENQVDAGGWDLRDAIAAYPKPLLLLLADPSDSVVSADDAAFVRAHAGPKVRVEVFEGEGHSLQRTAFERFAAVATPFIEGGSV